MSRNRVKNSQSLHWMGVVKWVLITGLGSGLGLTYMLCKNQNLHLAAETHRLQVELSTIETRNRELSVDLESMKSMKKLKKRLDDMHSSLVQWGDPQANWVRLDQNPHARVAQMGTQPKAAVNLDASVVTAEAPQPVSQPVH